MDASGESGSDRGRVTRAASLARLALGDARTVQLAGELARILDHFRTLARVDVEGVEALVRPPVPTDTPRADEPVPSLPRDELLRGAPRTRDGFFVVPRTVDAPGGDGGP